MINLIVFLTSSIMTAIICTERSEFDQRPFVDGRGYFHALKEDVRYLPHFGISLKLLEATLLAAKLALSCGPPAMFNVLFGVPFGAFG